MAVVQGDVTSEVKREVKGELQYDVEDHQNYPHCYVELTIGGQ